MNQSPRNHFGGKQSTEWKEQTIEKEVGIYNQNKQRIEKIIIQIKFTSDQQIIYQRNGAILRIEQVHDVFENPDIFNNMDQIKYLSWQGQYNLNKKKDGKWIITWDKNILQNVGGQFKNGQKQGQWKDLFLNYYKQANIFETGKYYNNLRIGQWYYIFQDAKIGGGFYNQDSLKQGLWVELDEGFYCGKRVAYNGEYQSNGMKVGRWNTMYGNRFENKFKQIGGGSFDKEGNQKKIGKWIELDEGFDYNKKVTYIGEYNMNGKKIGIWEIMYDKWGNRDSQQMQKQLKYRDQSGGGSYDQEGNQKKIGKWIELDEGFYGNKKVTFNGVYNMNGIKIGRWDTMYEGVQIGGGTYDQSGNQKKIGKWVELDKEFDNFKKVIYAGEYNVNGNKTGSWNILHFQDNKKEFKQIGGGSYDKEGSQKKIGKWIELDEKFSNNNQVIYNGEFNLNCMKVGRWEILYHQYYDFNEKGYQQIGGGSYDQEGYQKKIGKWIELDQEFKYGKQITHNGEYNMNGMKINRWDIWFTSDDGYQQSFGGLYDQEGNQKKIGKWVELDEGFDYNKQITYHGEYDMNSRKVGKWDIFYWRDNEKEFKLIGGGSYDQEGSQKKIGKWVELDERFYDDKQITYIGEYNVNGQKIGRWDIIYKQWGNKEYKLMQTLYKYKGIYSGGGSYDQQGNQQKIGNWIELDECFKDCKEITYSGQYDMNSRKVGKWDIFYWRDNEKEIKKMQILYKQKGKNNFSGGGQYDQEGSQKKFGKWVELDERFHFWEQITHNGEYNSDGVKVGRWEEIDTIQHLKRGKIDYDY
ncbi:unnamed protein product [Paramecium sonneborni]|uniref:Uncharacterized protein n=1 Tax=Paramecium sonneborni TaxID=65129 RepID=A0A8S1RLF3_9CILI|nr:unnamed protein product [Paramecium sonneborni]